MSPPASIRTATHYGREHGGPGNDDCDRLYTGSWAVLDQPLLIEVVGERDHLAVQSRGRRPSSKQEHLDGVGRCALSFRRMFSRISALRRREARMPGENGAELQVIELRLMRAHDMFEMPQTDLFSEYRNFLTGVDFCISELRSRRSWRPLRLEIRLPPEEIDDEVGERLSRTLRRYCNHRIRYNLRESRAQRVGGVSALRIGIPISVLGLGLTAAATTIRPSGGAVQLVTDHLGWVLAWLGVWFPLDQFLFNPLAYGRESRVLRLLYDSEVVVTPHRPTSALAVPGPASTTTTGEFHDR